MDHFRTEGPMFLNLLPNLFLDMICKVPPWALSSVSSFKLGLAYPLDQIKISKLFSERLVLHSFLHSPSFLSWVHNHMSQMILEKKKTDFGPTQIYVVVIIHLFTYLLIEMLFGDWNKNDRATRQDGLDPQLALVDDFSQPHARVSFVFSCWQKFKQKEIK